MPILLQKFKVALNDDGKILFEEVEGSVVKNDYGLDLFVYRTKSGKFKVSEQTTGCSLTSAFQKKKEAIEEVHNVVSNYGVEAIKERIKTVMEMYNINHQS